LTDSSLKFNLRAKNKGRAAKAKEKYNVRKISEVNNEDDLFKRLFEDNKKRDEKHEQRKMIKQKMETVNCTFRPLRASKSQTYFKDMNKQSFFEKVNDVNVEFIIRL
jgi:hypothetical protein